MTLCVGLAGLDNSQPLSGWQRRALWGGGLSAFSLLNTQRSSLTLSGGMPHGTAVYQQALRLLWEPHATG